MSKKKKEWRAEKERLFSLGLEERRKEYRGRYVTLDKIPTWRQHESGSASKDEKEHPLSLCDRVSLHKGDITILEVDAIVNAANSSLLGGGGVDGCIHRAAGHFLYDECHSLNGCDTGKAKITCGYDLPAKYVIHTVGPIARGNVGPSESKDLKSCYENSLKLLKDNKLRSVAFPCISTGIYGFPNEPAANIALKTVKDWIKENKDEIDRVIFCVFLETDFEIYNRKMSDFFSPELEEDEEATEAQQDDDASKETSTDAEMLTQPLEDEVMETEEALSQTQVCDAAGDDKNGKEETEEKSETVDNVKPVEQKEEEEEKEAEEEEKKKKEEEGDVAARESGEEEKSDKAASAEMQEESEKDQAKMVETKEEESQKGIEAMEEEEGVPDADKNRVEDNEKEISNTQDMNPQESDQATPTDSSQSKDGAVDKSEKTKE